MNDISPDSEPQGKFPKTDRTEEGCTVQRALTFLLTVGGVSAVSASLLFPSLAGATRTARLEWERRQEQISHAAVSPAPSALPPQP